MSDTLEERLNRHSDSFQGLLSLIPAKYYFDEETQSQWNRKKTSKSDKREAKKAKLDPLNGSSAADEAKRRAEAAALQESDSDVSVIYDDNGNEIRLKPEEDESSDEGENIKDKAYEKPNSKPNGKSDAKLEAKSHAKPDQKPANGTSKAKADTKAAAKPATKAEKPPNPKENSNSKAAAPSKPTGKQQATKEQKQEQLSSESLKEAGSPKDETAAAAKAAGINELRNKLQARINQLREKRKAPGTSAPGAPKSREELLAVRKQKLEQKKSQKRKRGDETAKANDENAGGDEDVADAEQEQDEDLIFGGVSFKDGQKVGKDLSLAADKKIKKRTIQDQLKVLEQRKSKLENLDESKREDIEEKAKWSRMILQSEGAKLKDNEKLLKKALKQKKNKKLKSELQWNERKQKVAEDIASREAKRNRNIANHTVIKHAKGKNQKKKLRQRAGFEGKKRRKN